MMGILPGGIEWVVILVVALLLFGGKKLPELAKGLGKSITNFKSGLNESQEDETDDSAANKKEVSQKEEVS